MHQDCATDLEGHLILTVHLNLRMLSDVILSAVGRWEQVQPPAVELSSHLAAETFWGVQMPAVLNEVRSYCHGHSLQVLQLVGLTVL